MVWRHVVHLESQWSTAVPSKLFASVWLASPLAQFGWENFFSNFAFRRIIYRRERRADTWPGESKFLLSPGHEFLFSSAVTKKDGGTTSLVELHVKSITSSSLICIPRLRVSWGGDLSSDFHCAITDALKIGGPSSPVARKGWIFQVSQITKLTCWTELYVLSSSIPCISIILSYFSPY